MRGWMGFVSADYGSCEVISTVVRDRRKVGVTWRSDLAAGLWRELSGRRAMERRLTDDGYKMVLCRAWKFDVD
jgi:hypothetical protein